MREIQQSKIYLIFGDREHEIILIPDLVNSLQMILCLSDLKFSKSFDGANYISEKLDLYRYISNEKTKIYSSVGEISYFIEKKRFVINFHDEESTLGEPRVVIGKIRCNTDFYQVAELLRTEIVKMRFDFLFGSSV